MFLKRYIKWPENSHIPHILIFLKKLRTLWCLWVNYSLDSMRTQLLFFSLSQFWMYQPCLCHANSPAMSNYMYKLQMMHLWKYNKNLEYKAEKTISKYTIIQITTGVSQSLCGFFFTNMKKKIVNINYIF